MTPSLTLLTIVVAATAIAASPKSDSKSDSKPEAPLPTLEEARGRARLLHRTIHATLQVVHRDFFRPDEKLPIPSQSFEDVFADLETSQNVKFRWLAVTSKAMDDDHRPEDTFEENAVAALVTGDEEFEAVEKDIYRYAATIRLHGSCIKCHVPTQHGDEKHNAGLVISMPIRKE